MRVFSTFSGIGAATAAWKPLGWTFVGYAEVNPYACAVLAERCGTTRPRYIPFAEHAYLGDEMWLLADRLSDHAPAGKKTNWLIRDYLRPGEPRTGLSSHRLEELYEDLFRDMADVAGEELKYRKKLLAKHRSVEYRSIGAVPNFGDIWSITDDELEELGPIDVLEGGSPCQAFSAAGSKLGMLDHRSALMLAYLDLVERMRRINNLQWILWENVKGVLHDPGNGFGTLLGQLACNGGGQLEAGKYRNAGYVCGPDGAVAWRVLDTQRFGRPQRRERVFALGHVGLGTPRRDPREILFEPVRDGWRPAPKGKSPDKSPVGVPEGSADTSGGSGRLVVYMAGQSASARSIAESARICPTLRSTKSGSNMVPRVAYALPGNVEDGAEEGNEEADRYVVRKLRPVEAERLQGFEEGWTAVEVNGAIMPDDERQACLGNTMTVDVMRWIGNRLAAATRDDAETEAA